MKGISRIIFAFITVCMAIVGATSINTYCLLTPNKLWWCIPLDLLVLTAVWLCGDFLKWIRNGARDPHQDE